MKLKLLPLGHRAVRAHSLAPKIAARIPDFRAASGYLRPPCQPLESGNSFFTFSLLNIDGLRCIEKARSELKRA